MKLLVAELVPPPHAARIGRYRIVYRYRDKHTAASFLSNPG